MKEQSVERIPGGAGSFSTEREGPRTSESA
jgi:hypothetical protein